METSKKILYIEDNEMNRLLVRRILEKSDYRIFEAMDGISGVRMAEEILPDLILMDINLPLLDGYAATTRIKSIPSLKTIPIVAITSNAMEGDRERALVAGCDGYIRKPLDPDEFPVQIDNYLSGRRETVDAGQGAMLFKEYNDKLVERLQHHIEELEKRNLKIETQAREMQEAYLGVIMSFVRAVEEKHAYTAGHSARVRALSMKIGEQLQLSREDMETLSVGSLLHDIGKLVIEISSLKGGHRLSDEEWREMKKHPDVGHKILKPIAFLSNVLNIVHQHHERWDGTGYPQGLKGDRIDFLAGIVAVTDSYDAMTTSRGYNQVLTPKEALKEILRTTGTYFNPTVVEAFIPVVEAMIQRSARQASSEP